MQAVKLKNLRDPAEMKLPRLEEDPRYRAVAEELTALETRLAEAERRERVGEARRRGQKPTRGTLERARDLVAGGSIVASDPQAEIAAATEEQLILREACNEKREQLAAVRGAISFEACKKFAEANADALRNALEAATQLHIALEVGRVIRGMLIGSGYELNAAVLAIHMFPAGAALGDPDRVGMTPAAMFKQWLIDRAIV
jgi:hypothetical protein